MPEAEAGKEARKTNRPPRMSPQTLALWALFFGFLVALFANIRQDQKTERLAADFATLRQENQKEIAALRDAQSASLEQDLLRLDQLTTQVQKTSEDEVQQAASLASRTRAELARTVEQRHQEMITAISDLRADLRSEANSRTSQPNVQKPITEDVPVPVVADFSAPPAASLISQQKPSEEQPTPSPVQKKSFWSKLNPFSRHSQHTSNPANQAPD
ncbi:MAG: hypothetical protein ACLPWF_13360 [Bryobacteraceae bacterium]